MTAFCDVAAVVLPLSAPSVCCVRFSLGFVDHYEGIKTTCEAAGVTDYTGRCTEEKSQYSSVSLVH